MRYKNMKPSKKAKKRQTKKNSHLFKKKEKQNDKLLDYFLVRIRDDSINTFRLLTERIS